MNAGGEVERKEGSWTDGWGERPSMKEVTEGSRMLLV